MRSTTHRSLLRPGGWAILALLAALVILAALWAPPARVEPLGPWTQPDGKGHGSGVLVSYSVPARTAPGAVAKVRLRLSGVKAADGASVSVRDLTDGRTLLALKLAPGEDREVEVSVTSRADGMQFIDVITTQSGRTSVITVPLAVGRGVATIHRDGRTDVGADGEAVVVLPATTTRSAQP